MSDPAPQIGTPLHGPGGLLGTPGLGSRRRKTRKWGMRTKAKQIKGNLYRGDTGKFQAGSGGTPGGATPKRGNVYSKQPPPPKRTPIKTTAPKKGRGAGGAKKPKQAAQTPEQRQAARTAEQAQNRSKVLGGLGIAPDGQAALEALRSGQQPDPAAIARAGFEQAGLVERAQDGSYRMTGTGRALMNAANAGDAGRAGDSISSARDRTTARGERRAAAADRKKKADAKRAAAAATAAAKKPKAGGGGGGGGSANRQAADIARSARQEAADAARASRAQATAERRRQVEARRAAAVADRQAKQQRVLDRLKRQAQAGIKLTQAQRNQLTDAGMADESSGMWRVKAETYGGTKRSNLDEDIFAGPDRSFPIVTAQDVKDAVRSLGRTKHDKDAVKQGIIRRAKAIGAMDALPEDWRTKSFTVFKDHAGQHRWIARTTTAYRDRDGEIISEAALDADSLRMMATKQFGPLRYWHIGQPDPFDMVAPWGPGLDIGDCDYSTVIGRTSIESGTFRNVAIGQAFAASADDYELSPGFFHPIDEPRPGGIFDTTRRFERSVVPIKYGRASNLFTGLTVKEHRMDQATYEARVKAYLADMNGKGVPPEVAASQLALMEQSDKSAENQGIAFKSDDAPAPPEEITIGGVVYAVKAAPPAASAPMDAEDDPALGGDSGVDEEAEGEPPLDDTAQMAGDYIGDMSWDEFAAKLGALLAPVLKMQDMVKSIGDAHAELKGMYGGVAQKDDARAQELTGLKSQFAALAAKIAQIEGDQPATILPDDVAAALKSAGPQAPADPNAPDVPNDPSRPYAAIAARTMPALYRTDAGGGFAGWTPPPTAP
jgi:hypothetical protein